MPAIITSPLALHSLRNRLLAVFEHADTNGYFVDILRTVEMFADERDGLKAVSLDMAYPSSSYTCIRAEGTDEYLIVTHRVKRTPFGEPMHINSLGEIRHSDSE